MSRGRFLKLVRRALDELPSPYDEWLDNVDVVIERRPSRHQRAGLGPGETLYGLYEGVPLTDRTSDYGLVLPDKITIFQEPLELDFTDDDELVDEVRRTVLHELAHYFGISDDELERLGLD
ncbi:MAG: metallopeptidase family protein [Dehalococcoidia bacterium]|nr:metallopeptidase family protein [Dehalococcoidia bacterium]